MRACTIDIERLKNQLRWRVVSSLFFAEGNADILPEGAELLHRIASTISKRSGALRFEGHTDDVPIGANLKD